MNKDNFRPTKKYPPSPRGLGRSSLLESHGPEGKIRGTIPQLVERYMGLGRDALRDSNAVMAESFFQHAEHYRRLYASLRRADMVTHGPLIEEEEEKSLKYSSVDDQDSFIYLPDIASLS